MTSIKASSARPPSLNTSQRISPNEEATSRKSWRFSDTVDGAKASATIYSLVLTCRACGVEPYDYLLHVLRELPQRPPDADVTDLLPFNYARQPQARV